MTSNSERGESPLFQEITPQTPKHTDPSSNLEPVAALSHGRVLTKNLQAKFSDSNAWGKPLEDPDPFYATKDTFVVVSSNYRIWRFSSHNSLFLFDRLNALRRFCLLVLTHWISAVFMISVVSLDVFIHNSDFLIPRDHYHIIRYVCLLIYLIEFVVKLISMGFVMTPLTYLRSGWSWIDIFTIIDSALDDAMFGAVRLLKIIPYSAGTHLAFGFYWSCIVRLKEMIISSVVIVSLFAIMGLQMYMGTLTQKCISNYNHSELNDTEYGEYYKWELHHLNASNFYSLNPESDTDYPLCGNATGSGQCPEGYTCMQGFGKNPDYGFTSFDSFGWGFLSVLRFTTQDFAEALYRQIVTANSHFHGFYFIMLFFVGTYGLGTFAYAIIAACFLDRKHELGGYEETENLEQDNKTSNSHVLFDYCLSWNFSPGFNSFRRKTHCFVFHPFAELCITLIIILDVILMTFNVEQHVFSQIFCCIYVIEFLVKLFTESPKDYFNRTEHILDFMIVTIFIASWVIYSPMLHSFLVLRMLKLYPRWPSLNFIIQAMLNSLKTYRALFLYFALLFLFFVTQSFEWFNGGRHRAHLFPGSEFPRWNYLSFTHSFMSIFRILSGDWIETLWDFMLVVGGYAVTFTVPTVFLMYLIMMILSVAVAVTAGETFAKIEFQENPLYSKLEQALKQVCVPVTWIRSKINPGGQTHDILEEAPIHGHFDHNTHGDSSTPPPEENQRKSMIDLIIDNKYRNWVSIAVIIWGSIAIALDDVHVHRNSTIKSETELSGNGTIPSEMNESESTISLNIIFYSDIVFTIYFILDILLNLFGCLVKKRFDKPGCIFDSLLIFEMILNLFLYSPYTSPGHGILYVKSFRPFMLVSRIERLQVVLTGFMTEISLLAKYLLAGLFVWLMFDIQGVQLFSHQFYKCTDPANGETPDSRIIENKVACHMNNFTWENSYRNFDNAFEGFHSVISIATFIGWIQIIYDATDARGVDEQPSREFNYSNSIYFVIFAIFGVFFIANIMVGILIHFLRKNTYQGIFMTFDQFYEYKGKLRQLESPSETTPEQKAPEPASPFLKFFYDFVENHFFDKFIMFVILLHFFILTFDHYQASEFYMWVLDISHLLVTSIYIVEAVLKLLGWRWHYFKNVYNRWDFFIVINMIIGITFSDLVEMYFIAPGLFMMIRIFRIFQFEPFRRRAVTTQKFLSAFFLIQSSFFNLLGFFVVTIFSYALLFMSIFQHVKLRAMLNPLFNFQTFGSSFRMLVEMSNIAGWDGVSEVLSNDNDCSLSDPTLNIYSDCGWPAASALMMGSYLTLSCFIVVNMYIIFILEIVRRVSENGTSAVPLQTLERNATVRNQSEFSSSSEHSSPIQ